MAYTQHCFAALQKYAGCVYDHLVLDQGSEDGTRAWLLSQDDLKVFGVEENIGISPGLNMLLDACNTIDYDVIVHFDNDCELTQPDTIKDLCRLVYEGSAILSPRILGLNNPPTPTREVHINGELILDIPQIGGICLAAPAWWYDDFRYPAHLPMWGMEDVFICQSFRANGGTCGYVKRLEAWHYEGTAGQHARYPAYFDRTRAEGKTVL